MIYQADVQTRHISRSNSFVRGLDDTVASDQNQKIVSDYQLKTTPPYQLERYDPGSLLLYSSF